MYPTFSEPEEAASVKTFLVCWKEAADNHELVNNDEQSNTKEHDLCGSWFSTGSNGLFVDFNEATALNNFASQNSVSPIDSI